MKKQILIVTAAALTAAVVILNGTSAATAQQTPQYEVAGFPITPLQMLALQPSAKIKERQCLSRQRTMDASRRAVVGDPDLTRPSDAISATLLPGDPAHIMSATGTDEGASRAHEALLFLPHHNVHSQSAV
jgi:hypothetical protein